MRCVTPRITAQCSAVYLTDSSNGHTRGTCDVIEVGVLVQRSSELPLRWWGMKPALPGIHQLDEPPCRAALLPGTTFSDVSPARARPPALAAPTPRAVELLECFLLPVPTSGTS